MLYLFPHISSSTVNAQVTVVKQEINELFTFATVHKLVEITLFSIMTIATLFSLSQVAVAKVEIDGFLNKVCLHLRLVEPLRLRC